jgi:hypothetical protein
MPGIELIKTIGGKEAQVFYHTEGLTHKTTGYVLNPRWCECVTAGDLTVTWASSAQSTISFTEGMRYGFVGVTRVDIVSGEFHF